MPAQSSLKQFEDDGGNRLLKQRALTDFVFHFSYSSTFLYSGELFLSVALFCKFSPFSAVFMFIFALSKSKDFSIYIKTWIWIELKADVKSVGEESKIDCFLLLPEKRNFRPKGDGRSGPREPLLPEKNLTFSST